MELGNVFGRRAVFLSLLLMIESSHFWREMIHLCGLDVLTDPNRNVFVRS